MASQPEAYRTKRLSKKTWPDFARLFSQGNGWDHCWCMHFHRPRGLPRNKWLPTRAERGVRNRREKRELVKKGRSHGILVYAKGEPVGWCQYGPQEELPRIDNRRKYRGLAPGSGLVEAYPITRWEARAFGNESTHGTASMFEKAGFKAVAPLGSTRFSTHVLMQRTV